MKRPTYDPLVQKSVQACLAAIEIYNKPDFKYREEAFSILMLNAWELLLKARVMKENRGSRRSIVVMEPRRKKDGKAGKRFVPKLGRSGNAITIGTGKAAEIVRQYKTDSIDEACVDNISVLQEVRDNAVHLHNIDPALGKRLQEVGSAALKNYARGAQKWFKVDLSRYNFYLMPISFHSPAAIAESLSEDRRPTAVRKLLSFIAEAERRNPSDQAKDFNVTLGIELKFVRSSGSEAVPVRYSKDEDAVKVQLTEEDIRKRYPWDTSDLLKKLKERYDSGFVRNSSFYKIKKPLEADSRYCRIRHLDPAKPKLGLQRAFFSPAILEEFDKHYCRKDGPRPIPVVTTPVSSPDRSL